MDGRAAHEPRLRFGVALPVAVAGLLPTTVVPDLSAANRGHVLLYYLSFIAATALVLLAVAAPEVPAANWAADRLQGWVRRAMLLLRLRVRGRLIRAASFLFTAGGGAAVVIVTIPGNSADPNPHLVMVAFLFFIVGILVMFYRVAAPDLPDGENAVARLELE